jgi:hypothetical protein
MSAIVIPLIFCCNTPAPTTNHKGIEMTVNRAKMVEENLVVWSIRLPPSQIEQVKKAARKRKMTPSDLVRQILDNALI